MLTDFKLPGLGENIASGMVTKIMVNVGDAVKKDQMVLELETDKAVLEVPSPESGVVKEILIKVGQAAKVGQVVMKIDIGATAGAKPGTHYCSGTKALEETWGDSARTVMCTGFEWGRRRFARLVMRSKPGSTGRRGLLAAIALRG